jgi:hypothetical protein
MTLQTWLNKKPELQWIEPRKALFALRNPFAFKKLFAGLVTLFCTLFLVWFSARTFPRPDRHLLSPVEFLFLVIPASVSLCLLISLTYFLPARIKLWPARITRIQGNLHTVIDFKKIKSYSFENLTVSNISFIVLIITLKTGRQHRFALDNSIDPSILKTALFLKGIEYAGYPGPEPA